MDLIVRNARLIDRLDDGLLDIAVENGRIAAIGRALAADGEGYDAAGRLVCAGLIESHIHLDKSRIADRCPLPDGRRVNPVTMVAPLKPTWTVEDVYQRAEKTLHECLVNGTTRMRTQVEIDPGIGLRGFEAIRSLATDYRWAIDIELCGFPQDGLTNYPGTEELLVTTTELAGLAGRLRDAGIAVTVLPATDLYLMGRERDHAVVRGVADATFLSANGLTCSLSSNNILNAATPFGDCSLIRIANLQGNVLQIAAPAELRELFLMLSERSAKLLNLKDYGLTPGNPADLVVIDAATPEQAVAEIRPPLAVWKRGRQTVIRHPPELLRPH